MKSSGNDPARRCYAPRRRLNPSPAALALPRLRRLVLLSVQMVNTVGNKPLETDRDDQGGGTQDGVPSATGSFNRLATPAFAPSTDSQTPTRTHDSFASRTGQMQFIVIISRVSNLVSVDQPSKRGGNAHVAAPDTTQGTNRKRQFISFNASEASQEERERQRTCAVPHTALSHAVLYAGQRRI